MHLYYYQFSVLIYVGNKKTVANEQFSTTFGTSQRNESNKQEVRNEIRGWFGNYVVHTTACTNNFVATLCIGAPVVHFPTLSFTHNYSSNTQLTPSKHQTINYQEQVEH